MSAPGLGGHLRAIHASLEPPEIVAAALAAVGDLAGVERVHGFLRDAAGRLQAVEPGRAASPDGVNDPWLDLGLDAEAPVRVGAPELPPRAAPSPFAGLRAGLVAPLRIDGRVLGALVAGAPAGGTLSFVEELLLREVATHAAVALDRAGRVRDLVEAERVAVTGRLAAGIAHELNGPLAVILGAAELLRRDDVDPRLADALGRIVGEAQRAARLLRGLLQLARPEPARRVAVDLRRLVDDAIAVEERELQALGGGVTRREASCLPPVAGDPGQLRQALGGVIRQAARGAREGGRAGRVVIATRHDGPRGRVIVEVADDGPGVAPEALPALFEPFAAAGGRGGGLDLALARRLVEQHGGAIRADSPEGGGLRLTVDLPVAAASAARGASAAGRAGVRVLLVEDERVVGDLLAEILAREGHQVDRAANGREALARVRERPYALIVSDVRMPDVDGPTFYRELATTDPHLARSVVFVTGDVMSPDTRRFLDETSLRYLEKPFTLAEFQEVVRSLVGQPEGPSPDRGRPVGT